MLAERAGSRLGLSKHDLRAVVLAALLTELGKLRIPESVRRKRGPLSEHDWQLVRESAELTAGALAPLGYLGDVLEVVGSTRERWDGTGYPDGLVREEIPLGARIVAVCDAFCAMTSRRSYRPARTRARAVLELREGAGTHFDPACVRVLVDLLGEAGAEARSASGLRVAAAATSP